MCAKLMSGQIQVVGDQWPVFLYANYTYCAGDLWNGLLQSGLLILVSLQSPFFCYYITIINRHLNTSLHLLVL